MGRHHVGRGNLEGGRLHQAAWQKLAAEPTQIEEHTPEQHKKGNEDPAKR
jgi:hypothetical protein